MVEGRASLTVTDSWRSLTVAHAACMSSGRERAPEMVSMIMDRIVAAREFDMLTRNDKWGETPLMHAVRSGRPNVVRPVLRALSAGLSHSERPLAPGFVKEVLWRYAD